MQPVTRTSGYAAAPRAGAVRTVGAPAATTTRAAAPVASATRSIGLASTARSTLQASSVSMTMPMSPASARPGVVTSSPLSTSLGQSRVISSAAPSAVTRARSPAYTTIAPTSKTLAASATVLPASSAALPPFGTSTIRTAPVSTIAAAPLSTVASAPVTTIGGARPATIISSGYGPSYGAPRIISSGATYGPSYGAPTIISSGYPAAATMVMPQNANFAGGALAGADASQAAYELKHQDDAQLQNLKAVKKECGLKKVHISTAAQAFKNAAIGGSLTREQFFNAHAQLLASCGVAMPPVAVKNAVFDLFDRDDNDVIDMMELICGLSLLCQGAEEEKVEAVFLMFDENGDGFVTQDEMYKFLQTVFKVVCTPAVMGVVNSVGVTVESTDEMASATTLECFQNADLNHDGRISLDEFKKWFSAPKNDPALLFEPVKNMLG